MAKFTKEQIDRIKKSPWNFFIKNSKVTFLLILIIVLWGGYSLSKLPQEIQPEIDLPFGVVMTPYPGANPLDVEELVTNKIESGVKNVENIKQLSSSSQFGMSSVFIEFEAETDIDSAIEDVKSAVDISKKDLPEDAEDPIVAEFESNSLPVINFSLVSDLPDDRIKNIAEEVSDELEKVIGVSDVIVIGAPNKKIYVDLKPDLLETYGISLAEIQTAIRTANINFPIGGITIDGFNYGLRVEAAVENAQELSQIPIKNYFDQSGVSRMITLQDIAEVHEDLEEKKTISRVGLPNENTIQNSISLQVYKKKGGNIVKVAQAAKKKMDELEESMIPKTVIVHISSDNSKFVQKDLEVLGRNGIQTIILIMVLLFIFLGFKEGIIAGLSLPFSLLITFGVLRVFNQTLNGITLFSLVFALGLLIDNSVIIVEGIYENLKSKKYTSYGSAILGVFEYKWPIIAGTLTTVFAFLPMLFISGIMGQFMRVIPITVTAILLSSLIVNLSITPTIATKFLKPGKQREHMKRIRKWYKSFIDKVIKTRFTKWLYLLIMLAVFGVSLSLPITGTLKSEAFPVSDFDFFYVDLETPSGTVLEDTDKIVNEIEAVLLEVPEVSSFITSVGSNAGGQFRSVISTSQSKENISTITVNLVEPEERERKSYEISIDVREKLNNIQGGEIDITDLQGGPPSGAPIEARITGIELDKIEKIAHEIETDLKSIEGTLDVETSIEKGAGEFNITLNREKLNFYGLAPIQVASLLRNTISGVEATEIRKDGEDISVMLHYVFEQHGEDISLEDLKDLMITSPTGVTIPVRSLINMTFQENLTSISHLDTKRVMYVTSYVQGKTAPEITVELQEKIKDLELPEGYEVDFGGEIEDVQQSFEDLGVSMLVGLILIFILLVLQFKSYSQPFIIILSLPFALTGVFFGLTIMGMTLSLPAFIGVVGLAGVVVNDAIVLIDQMNNNRKRGMNLHDAIVEGATSRMQPVFLTTVTSICGILPLALTDEVWGSLGFAFIFGLSTQFFLVLLLDPILYSIFVRKGSMFKEKEVLLPQPEINHFEKNDFHEPMV